MNHTTRSVLDMEVELSLQSRATLLLIAAHSKETERKWVELSLVSWVVTSQLITAPLSRIQALCNISGVCRKCLGGVLNCESGCTVRVHNSVFNNNSAYKNGGVFRLITGHIFITKSNFSLNIAGSDGGVLSADKKVVAIVYKCYFVNNTAYNGGGVMGGMDIAIKFSCSCFINNTARTGGALSVLSGLLIKQCHFISNFARLGGGVYTRSVITNNDTLKVIECMFANNTASCLLYTSPSPRDATLSRMPSSA